MRRAARQFAQERDSMHSPARESNGWKTCAVEPGGPCKRATAATTPLAVSQSGARLEFALRSAKPQAAIRRAFRIRRVSLVHTHESDINPCALYAM